MIKKIALNVIKILTYVAFVILAIVYTPKLLAKVLGTPYPLATVTSGSMWPLLKENDLILMKGASGQDVKLGQIIVYKNPVQNSYIIHRLVRKVGDKLVTKGDANSMEDSPIAASSVIGRVVYIGDRPLRVPYLGLVARKLAIKPPT